MNSSAFFPKIASRCETCHGAGILPGRCREDELVPCPTCCGKGVITHKVSKKHVEERPCDNPNCKNGRVQQIEIVDGREVTTEKVCPVCDGYAVLYKETVETTTESEKCPTCEGRAVVAAGELRRRKIEGICPSCHGVGYRLEEKPAKRFALVGISAFVYPVVTLVSLAFTWMIKSVKAAVVTKASKQQDQEQ